MAYVVDPIEVPPPAADTARMTDHICEECNLPGAEIGDVVTGVELLSALAERTADDHLEITGNAEGGECLVYMLFCELCGWQSMRSTERIKLLEDPEPIG